MNFFGPEMLLRIPALLIAITFHEFAHAKVSDALGDPTPAWSGRLSLNPLVHLDPVGLLMLWIFKFGWAKPVQVNPTYYKNPRQGIMLVSLAGPLSNLLLAFITLALLKSNLFISGLLESFIYLLFLYNLTLAVFNLIPIPPLDGSKILMGFLPGRQAYMFSQLEAYGPIILIALAYFGFLDGVLEPLISVVYTGLDNLTNIILLRL
ncbi:site-2 protease family protein [Thermoanaerobacterium sp. DL9XJH110]|uniref:site-2 protease family protein n=1 Tax=Thermoanaerobacterium sp. DL9XJH110 TaxID=3386643 RepID=UPI003BB614DA